MAQEETNRQGQSAAKDEIQGTVEEYVKLWSQKDYQGCRARGAHAR
jgi:hypothetical protein